MAQVNSSTSSFKKFLFKIFLPSLAIIVPIAIATTVVFEKYIIISTDYSGVSKINRILNHNDSTETPIFGYSHGYNGIIPDSIGKNFYNYGIQGIGQNVLNFFLEEECKKKRNSPLIITDLNLEGFVPSLGKRQSYIYNAGNPDVKKLLGKTYSYSYNIPVIKYFGFFEPYFLDYLASKTQKVYSNKGSLLVKHLPDNQFKAAVNKRMETANTFSMDTSIENNFFSIIKHNPVRFFVFVFIPVHKSFYNHFNNYGQFKAFVQRLNAMSNVRVYDFSRVNYPDSLYYDSVHLDIEGAARFSTELKDSLAMLNMPAITNSLKK